MKSVAEVISENLMEDEILVGGHVFYLERIKDCEILLDHISQNEFEMDERLPYWAELWPAAVGLAEYILAHVHEFNQKSVLELGCGLGLAGMAAHKAGARVYFTDYDPQALVFTQKNFFRNFNRKADVKLMDWRKLDTHQKFDVIIAADVLYENRWLMPVRNIIQNLLKTRGVAFIAEPGRSVARTFFDALSEVNLKFDRISQNFIMDNKDRQTDIYRINKC